jgi:hypothetical protein
VNAEYEDLEFYFHNSGEAVIDGGEDPNVKLPWQKQFEVMS